jgi:predicted enzyme related to lactoylglutathione lyase
MFNTVCHFEIPADDVETLQKFYKGLFGWTFEKAPGPFDYYFIHTGSESLQGGMMARQHPQQGPVNYVLVESVEAAQQSAVNLGATVLLPKSPVPGMGWFAVLMDPHMNPIGLWQDDRSAS